MVIVIVVEWPPATTSGPASLASDGLEQCEWQVWRSGIGDGGITGAADSCRHALKSVQASHYTIVVAVATTRQ